MKGGLRLTKARFFTYEVTKEPVFYICRPDTYVACMPDVYVVPIHN